MTQLYGPRSEIGRRALMHSTVQQLENADFYVTAWVGHWHAATAKLKWVNCDHPPAYLLDAGGTFNELESPHHPALGTSGDNKPSFEPVERRLKPGERLILLTDGITNRQLDGGRTFGLDGVKTAVEAAASPTAAGTPMAIQQALTDCSREPFEDDATVVVMAVA